MNCENDTNQTAQEILNNQRKRSNSKRSTGKSADLLALDSQGLQQSHQTGAAMAKRDVQAMAAAYTAVWEQALPEFQHFRLGLLQTISQAPVEYEPEEVDTGDLFEGYQLSGLSDIAMLPEATAHAR